MKVSFFNIGCKVNYAELSQIREQFENLGYECVEFGEEADIVIINTCTVTANADADSRKFIRRALRTSPSAFVAVTGCYAQLKPEEIAKITGIGGIYGMNYKFHLPEIINPQEKNETQILVDDKINQEFEDACSIDNESHTRVVLKIQDGCDYFCSYCAVPYARGRSRSMKFNSILKKIEEIQDAGYYEIVLTGVNLGTYKSETGENFTNLISTLHNGNYKLRFRISSLEPELINQEIIEIVANSQNICPHLHIPLQSGSDDILILMRRRYTTTYFRKLIDKIYNTSPNICIGLDIITGFPGETEKLFSETYNLLLEIPFSYLHVFTYSERNITKASILENKIPPQIKKERTNLLRKLSEKKKNDFYRSQLNRNLTIIPETYIPEKGHWLGWSENYVRIAIEAQSNLKNNPINALVKEIHNNIAIAKIIL